MPYVVAVGRPNYCEIADAATNQCATYKRTTYGHWRKVSEQCKETHHDLQVALQRRRLGKTDA